MGWNNNLPYLGTIYMTNKEFVKFAVIRYLMGVLLGFAIIGAFEVLQL